MPFLSIIVPVYNVETYLPACLDSILAQTFTDFEILLVDDGSTDGSPALCNAYAAKDARIRCFHKKNGGHMSARQEGFRQASGAYAAFVDSDDWIDPAMYERMCTAAAKYDADVICCNYTAVTPEKHIERRDVCAPGFYDREELETKIFPVMLFPDISSTMASLPASAIKSSAAACLRSTFFKCLSRLNSGKTVWPFTAAFWKPPRPVFFRNPSIIIEAAAVPSPTRWIRAGLLKTVCCSIPMTS